MQTHTAPFKQSGLAAPCRIIVATDLNDFEFLLPHAIAQAKAAHARVTLLNAVPASYIVPADPACIPYVDGPKILRDTRLLMLGMAQRLESAGVECDIVCRAGDVVPILQEEIASQGATRLIMGTHGRGKIGQFALGSVAHDLLSRLDIPMFVVGSHAHAIPIGVPKRILHPVSLTGNYRETVQLAIDVARAYGASLTLLYVFADDIQREADPQRRIDWARTALLDLVPDEMVLASPVNTLAVMGKVPEEIVRAAVAHDVDCIVMGVNGGAPVRPFKEDAAYQVIARATCPVLTLRHSEATTTAVHERPIIVAAETSTPWIATAGIF